MHSVPLSKIVSKYLSKSIHFLTALVYLFTFLGPSLAIATSTLTYTETIILPKDQDSLLVQSCPFVDSTTLGFALEDSLLEQEISLPSDQNEKYINISKGWGPQSLYFGLGQTIQHLVSPLTLSQGNLPYEEVSEEGFSLGFKGSLEGIGEFVCCWDGSLLLQGASRKSSLSTSILPSPQDKGTLILETFAPVTFSNFIAKAVKATAQRIFFRGESALDEATLTPAKDSDLDAFCKTALGSITSIKDLTFLRGTLTSFGSFSAERVTIGQGASFLNGGHATIATLQGRAFARNLRTYNSLQVLKTSLSLCL
jgi:hypothetical protein